MNFLALFITLATRQSAGRMRVWRALRGLGAATLRDGVYLLPEASAHEAAFEQIAADVRRVEGSADIYLISARGAEQQQCLIGLFNRGALYAPLVAAMRQADPGDVRLLRRLRRELLAVSAIDFFAGEAQRQAQAAMVRLEAAAGGEPANVAGRIRRLAKADFQGRTWATRRHLWVDRLACGWLIRRFIDRQARFLWLDDPLRCPKKTLGFDFDGATFTHTDELVSFEVLAASFGLEADPAVARIAAIVHCLDVGGVPVPEAAGIEAILAGARAAARDDDALLAEASRLFDNLYAHYQQENSDA